MLIMIEAIRIFPSKSNPVKFTESEENRFRAKFKTGGELECWPWIAGRNKQGYGKFFFRKKLPEREQLAHRVAFLIHNGGFLPDGKDVVMHTCDNPCCVNPAHLIAGTELENIKDRDRKGRQSGPPKEKMSLVLRPRKGEAHLMAKLTDEKVKRIRMLHANGLPQSEIAREFGVTQANISLIVLRIHWKHLA